MNPRLSLPTWLIAVALALVAPRVEAGLSGTHTVGPTGKYASLTAALADIQAQTLSGPLVLELQASYGSAAETFPLTFSNLPTTPTNTLTIRPQAGATNRVITSAAAQTVNLDRARYVTFDGRAGGAGTARNLTIENTSPSGVALQLVNGASNHRFRFLNLRGSNGTTAGGIVVFGGSDGLGNSSNRVESCDLAPTSGGTPCLGILSLGGSVEANAGNAVTNCTIADFFHPDQATAGIAIDANSTGWMIAGNQLFQTTTRMYTTGNTHAGVRIAAGGGHTVWGNVIGFASPAVTGTWTMNGAVGTRFVGIEIAVETGTPTTVQGNLIGGFSLTTTSNAQTQSGAWCGINVTAGDVNVGTSEPNTIGGAEGGDWVAVTASMPGALAVAIHSSSTGTVAIQNNFIGGLSSAGAAPEVAGFITGVGVSRQAAGITISGNTIGNGTADNLRAGVLGFTLSGSQAAGINLDGTPTTASVTNNTIQNLSAYGIANSFARGIQTGTTPSATATGWSISGNTVRKVVTDGMTAGLDQGQVSAVGIHHYSSQGCVIAENSISEIANINTTATSSRIVAGIASANGSVSTALGTTITRNRIWALSNASTSTSPNGPPVVAGVLVRTGNNAIDISNNMIALGSGEATNTTFLGIWSNAGTAPEPTIQRIYHNSISITGTVASGALPSFGFHRGDFSNTPRRAKIEFRNNLVSNTRTGGTGAHYAIGNNFNTSGSATGWGTGASDGNLLNASADSVGYWGAPQTFSGWKAASFSDSHSVSGLAVNFVDAASDLHLAMGTTPTPLESGAIAQTDIATDLDGQPRPGPAGSVNGGAVAPDIGAVEFDGVPLDVTAPYVAFTPLARVRLTGETLSHVRITDVSGVRAAPTFMPYIYFRKGTGPWFGWPGTLESGTVRDGEWSFFISAEFMGGLAPGDLVSYFIVAQDDATPANIESTPPGAIATDTGNVTTPPPSVFTVIANPDLQGTVTVGAGGAFPTITAAIAAYNANAITGPTTLLLTDASYPNEAFPISINSVAGASETNVLTIKPAPGVQPVISGPSSTAAILFNGARHVVLDGHNGTTENSITNRISASRDLTIINPLTSTSSAVVWLRTTSGGVGTQYCTVQNCNISGSGPLLTNIGLGAGGPTIGSNGTQNHGLRFINNSIRACSVGIFSMGASPTNKNQGITIALNDLNTPAPANLGRIGISLGFTDAPEILANSIGEIARDDNVDVFGMTLGYGTNAITTFWGTEDSVSNSTVVGNRIGRLVQTNTYSAIGIAIAKATTGSTLIANNAISGVQGNGTQGDFSAGIFVGDVGAPVKVLHNTVVMQGAIAGLTPATQVSACFAVNNRSTSALELRNNIFSNIQGGNATSGMRFAAIALGTREPGVGMTSDHNALYAAGSGPGSYLVGTFDSLLTGTPLPTLTDWQAMTLQDAHSLNVRPTLVSATDIHLATESQAVISAGAAVSEPGFDFDGNPRNAPPDLGADEFFPSSNANLASLVLSSGSLSPAFNSAETSYTVNVPYATDFVTLTASPVRATATLAVNVTPIEKGEPSPAIPLAEGDNLLGVVVTAQSGATKVYLLNIHRNAKPALTLPTSTVIAEATSAQGAIVNFSVSAGDPEDGTTTLSVSPESGSLFPIGDTTVNVSATDSQNVTTTGSFVVHVQDTTKPTVSGNFSPLILFGGPLPDYRGQVVAQDAVGVVEITQEPAEGKDLGLGILPVVLTVRDAAGNLQQVTLEVALRPLGAVHDTTLAQGAAAPGRLTSADLPDDAVLTSFSLPATSDVGDLAFVAKWSGTVNGKPAKGTGLFLNDQCLAVSGGDASAIVAGARWASFSDPVVEDGRAACLAKLNTGATAVVGNFTGATLEKIAITGEAAPKAGDATFRKFSALALRGGAIGFLAQLGGGTAANKITAANDCGVWAREANGTLNLIYRDGRGVGDQFIGTFASFVPGTAAAGHGRGWLSHNTGALALAHTTFTDQSKALCVGSADGGVFLAKAGESDTNFAPALGGARFESFRLPAMNDALEAVFFATLNVDGIVAKSEAGGIFATSADPVKGSLEPSEMIAQLGHDAGTTGGKFRAFTDPVLDADGSLAFGATIAGPGLKGLAANTLWWRPAGGALRLLAQGGGLNGEPTDLVAGSQWSSFSSLALAAGRGPIFIGSLVAGKGGATAANASGVWAMDFTGRLRTLFRTGDTIGGKTLKSFTLLKATVGNAGVTRSFSDTGRVVWLATFTDKTTAIVRTDVP